MISALHHIQIAMPTGGEDEARRFYGQILELTEIEKPHVLAQRGGVWFEKGPVRVHLGVELDFRPATKAHPGFGCRDLDVIAGRLERVGFPVKWDRDLPGFRRFYTADPFGNRIEFLTPE